MTLTRRIGIGAEAGFFAGVLVATTFFVADFARLAPFATPMALQGGLLGSASTGFDSMLLGSVAIGSFASHLTAITLVHLLTFTGLGAVAVLACHACEVPLNVLTAALFGLVVFSLVFFGATAVTNAADVVELPGPGTVLLVNLLAGALMGAFYQWTSRAAEHAGRGSSPSRGGRR